MQFANEKKGKKEKKKEKRRKKRNSNLNGQSCTLDSKHAHRVTDENMELKWVT